MSTITFDFRHHYQRGERRESEQIAYQWDLGHVMEVFVPEDATYTIGYCFGDYEKTEDYAIDTKVQDPNGGYKLAAHIPNKYFERSGELRVYVVGSADDHIITTYEGFITIRGRLMPDDYVDDDPENGATQIIEVAREYATKSESFAVGGTGTRLGEDTDNAKYYLEQAEAVAESIPEDYSALSDDVNQLKNALKAIEIVDSASGAIASFPDDGDGFPVRDLKVQMEPIQAGSGDPSPDNVRPISGRDSVTVTRTGKNLFGGVYDEFFPLHFNVDTQVTASADTKGGNGNIRLAFYDSNKLQIDYWGLNAGETRDDREFTYPATAYYVKFTHTESTNYQIELGSTATAYEPYTAQTVEIPLGQTVYGGTLDVTNGVLTVDRACVTLDGSNDEYFATGSYGMPFKTTLPNDALLSTDSTKLVGIFSNQMTEVTQSSTWGVNCTCSMVANNTRDLFFKLNDDLTEVSALRTYLASNPMQLCYKLAQPLTVQLSPQQLTTLLGQNNVWSDADSVSVDYVADTKLYIAKVIAEALS